MKELGETEIRQMIQETMEALGKDIFIALREGLKDGDSLSPGMILFVAKRLLEEWAKNPSQGELH